MLCSQYGLPVSPRIYGGRRHFAAQQPSPQVTVDDHAHMHSSVGNLHDHARAHRGPTRRIPDTTRRPAEEPHHSISTPAIPRAITTSNIAPTITRAISTSNIAPTITKAIATSNQTPTTGTTSRTDHSHNRGPTIQRTENTTVDSNPTPSQDGNNDQHLMAATARTIENEHTKILGLNVCGQRSKLSNAYFDEYAKYYDILCLSETKISNDTNIDLSDTLLNDYFCYTKEKTIDSHQYGGVHGICMLIKNSIAKYSKKITNVQSPYVLWVQFDEKAFGLSCVIGSVYFPTENGDHKDKDLYDKILNDISHMKGKLGLPVCLIGDMNSRTGNLDDLLYFEREIFDNSELDNEVMQDILDINFNFFHNNSIINENRVNTDKIINENGKGLINLCQRTNVIIINGRTGSDRNKGDLTFRSKNGSSTIDYCITSPDFIPHIQNFHVDILDTNLSDKHSPIILTLNTKLNQNNLSQDVPSHETDISYEHIHSKWNAEKLPEFQANFDQNKIIDLSQTLDSINLSNLTLSDLDNVVKETVEVSITAGINTNLSKKITNIGPKKSKKPNQPWFDKECYLKRKHFIQLKRRILRKKTKSPTDDQALKDAAKLYKHFIKTKVNQFNKNLHDKLRKLKNKKPKEYWNILNPKKKKVDNSIDINSLFNHFKTLNEQTNTEGRNITVDDIPDNGDEILNNDFTIIELNKLINKLKNNKASGIDNIINEFLKFSPVSYKNLLIKLFNIILKTGIIPSDWCLSFINPIYKQKGEKSDPNNYRGISIISCLGKLFTALINERLTKFADLNEIIGEEQAGFRAGYSTQDHIFTLHAIIETYLKQIDSQNEKKKLYCAFIDYQKAFDLVDRSCLWSKLLARNIEGKIMRLIFNLYQNTKACVKHNNKLSQSFNCNIGVRQGDNLSPLLFAIFLNDFESFLSTKYQGLNSLNNLYHNVSTNDEILTLLKLYVLLYADDTIIMAEGPNELQLALDALSEYCQRWKLKINISKTKIIRFSKGKPKKNYTNFLFK